MISISLRTLLAIIGLLGIVSPILSWLLVRFTKPMDSYTEELAKQLARHQNLDKLVDGTRRLTDAVETIKAALSHENWDRQQRWTAKRDLYVRVAEALGEFRTAEITWKGLEELRLTRDLRDEKYASELEAKREDALRKMEEASDAWLRAVDVAPLMIPDEPYKPLREFKPRRIHFDTPTWKAEVEYNINLAQATIHKFHVAARADLGYEPMVWKPSILGDGLW